MVEALIVLSGRSMRVPFDFPNADFFFGVREEKSGERVSDLLSFCLLRYFYLNQCRFLTNFLLQVFAINLWVKLCAIPSGKFGKC